MVLLDEPSPAFDAIVASTATVCDTPIAAICFADGDSIRITASTGITMRQSPRSETFSTYALESREIMIVRDASEDPRFNTNSLVVGDSHIRFFAGIPLVVAERVVGTLCIADRKPRDLEPRERAALTAFARQLCDQLAVRNQLRAVDRLLHDLKNPLASLLPNCDFLLEVTSDADARAAIEDIQTAAHQMFAIVNAQ